MSAGRVLPWHRRFLRKLHIRLDADTGQIVAAALATEDINDGAEVGTLIDQVPRPIALFTADGACDPDDVSVIIAERRPEALIIVPPQSTAVPSNTVSG